MTVMRKQITLTYIDRTEVRLAKAFVPIAEIRLLFKNLTIVGNKNKELSVINKNDNSRAD